MVLTTPGIPRKFLEFLENSWNFEIFFQDPRNLLEKQLIFLYSWKTPGILWENISLIYKQTKICSSKHKHLNHCCTFCILCKLSFSCCYILWQNLVDIVLFLLRKNLGLGLGKKNSFPWKTPGKLLENSWNFLISHGTSC